MKCLLQLYLNGHYYTSKEIELSDDEDEMPRSMSQQIREEELKSAAEVFRIQHYRQIIKCQYNYDITATFKSKLRCYGPEFDFTGSEESDRPVDEQDLQ